MITAWVIEKTEDGKLVFPHMYVGTSDEWNMWTLDPYKSVRFSRREDADAMIEILKNCLGELPEVTATEHGWQ